MAARHDLYLCEINGGNLRNAIPREAYAICAVPEDAKHDVRTELNIFTSEMEDELSVVEPDLKLVLESETPRKTAIDQDTTTRLLKALYAAPHGVYAMSQDIPGLVQTSLNLGILKTEETEVCATFSVRSSVATQKEMLHDRLRCLMEQLGGQLEITGDYPAWEYRRESPLRERMVKVFQAQYGHDPKIEAIHAGVECGLLCGKLPGLDCVSVGPDLLEIHTPREKMSISSVQRVWDFLKEVLRESK